MRTPTGFQVDFLARDRVGAAHLIQVCADATEAVTAARELRALAEAGQRWATARRWLLTLTRDVGPEQVPEGVTACPAYEWMLGSW